MDVVEKKEVHKTVRRSRVDSLSHLNFASGQLMTVQRIHYFSREAPIRVGERQKDRKIDRQREKSDLSDCASRFNRPLQAARRATSYSLQRFELTRRNCRGE